MFLSLDCQHVNAQTVNFQTTRTVEQGDNMEVDTNHVRMRDHVDSESLSELEGAYQ